MGRTFSAGIPAKKKKKIPVEETDMWTPYCDIAVRGHFEELRGDYASLEDPTNSTDELWGKPFQSLLNVLLIYSPTVLVSLLSFVIFGCVPSFGHPKATLLTRVLVICWWGFTYMPFFTVFSYATLDCDRVAVKGLFCNLFRSYVPMVLMSIAWVELTGHKAERQQEYISNIWRWALLSTPVLNWQHAMLGDNETLEFWTYFCRCGPRRRSRAVWASGVTAGGMDVSAQAGEANVISVGQVSVGSQQEQATVVTVKASAPGVSTTTSADKRGRCGVPRFRALLVSLPLGVLVTFFSLLVISQYFRIDYFYLARHKWRIVRSLRGLLYEQLKWYCSRLLRACVHKLDIPSFRLHMQFMLLSLNALLVPLMLTQSEDIVDCLTFLASDWLSLASRTMGAMPLFPRNRIVRMWRSSQSARDMVPPLGMSIVKWRMFITVQECRMNTVGVLTICSLYPISLFLRWVCMEDPNVEDPTERHLALLNDFLFPRGTKTALFLVMLLVQELIQDCAVERLYRGLFGKDCIRFTKFIGKWNHWNTRKSIITWYCWSAISGPFVVVSTGMYLQLSGELKPSE